MLNTLSLNMYLINALPQFFDVAVMVRSLSVVRGFQRDHFLRDPSDMAKRVKYR